MFWQRKSESNPLGVPLGELQKILTIGSIKTKLAGSILLARFHHYTTRIEVVPPENHETKDVPIRAVVRVTTELPGDFAGLTKEPEKTAVVNRFAALGAVYAERGRVSVGSRLTIFEAEDHAWQRLHFPLLFSTTLLSTQAIIGALNRTVDKKEHCGGTSEWTKDDFAEVKSHLSHFCFCNAGDMGLTAEFGLEEGAQSAVLGHRTALLQLRADAPHPELGGGLFCLLQMPHPFQDREQLRRISVQLNNEEMAARDLPPHFGAWCEDAAGNTLSYASFLPNELRSAAHGIAHNVGIWAMHRAEWANTRLASLAHMEISGSEDSTQTKFKSGDRVRVNVPRSNICTVGCDVPSMQEFYRGAVLNREGHGAEATELLKGLLASKRVGTIPNGVDAVVVAYAVESGPEELRRVTRWGNLVQVRLKDDAGQVLTVWIDDSDLEGTDERHLDAA
jgi:hypothetical protein